MKERLLQYIWQFQYFNSNELITTAGEPVLIIHRGNFNTNQGADFSGAKIKIGDTVWAGNIELHIRSSDWYLHHHSNDKNYNNIILHVVWEENKPVKDNAGNNLPTIVLQNRVSNILLNKYETLMNASSFIPCENQSHLVQDITLLNWKQRLLAERLEAKSELVFSYLYQNNFHWEETFWWLIARNFGSMVNGEQFEKVARSLPVRLLAKHKNHLQLVESLLFGQAGLLEKNFTEEYPKKLQKDYRFYHKKHNLQQPQHRLFFLRMRPANFPSVRLAQLAMLISKSSHLFSKVIEEPSINGVKKLLDITAHDYWDHHYMFDVQTKFKPKKLGEQMTVNILINTIVPILFAYGCHHADQRYKDKAITWLENITSEKNVITKGFSALKFYSRRAFDSQAYIELKNKYCNQKRCLECAIGNALLKGGQV